MSPELEWVELEAMLVLHAASLSRHGGAEGVRDLGLLESALQRPQNRFHYESITDLAALAATYAAAISANHPFADGNKRAAFHALTLFLRINGKRLRADQADAARTILALAAGKLDLAELTLWVAERLADS